MVAMCGSISVIIQSEVSGRGALRYAHLMSIVAIVILCIMASWRTKENVSGFMVGL